MLRFHESVNVAIRAAHLSELRPVNEVLRETGFVFGFADKWRDGRRHTGNRGHVNHLAEPEPS